MPRSAQLSQWDLWVQWLRLLLSALLVLLARVLLLARSDLRAPLLLQDQPFLRAPWVRWLPPVPWPRWVQLLLRVPLLLRVRWPRWPRWALTVRELRLAQSALLAPWRRAVPLAP